MESDKNNVIELDDSPIIGAYIAPPGVADLYAQACDCCQTCKHCKC